MLPIWSTTLGEPGTEKNLLFTRIQASLALESNGLRMLVPLGFAAEGSSYSNTYRVVRDAVASQRPTDDPPEFD